MQAAILYAPNDLRIEERPMPAISPEEMRLEWPRVPSAAAMSGPSASAPAISPSR